MAKLPPNDPPMIQKKTKWQKSGTHSGDATMSIELFKGATRENRGVGGRAEPVRKLTSERDHDLRLHGGLVR